MITLPLFLLPLTIKSKNLSENLFLDKKQRVHKRLKEFIILLPFLYPFSLIL
jgi:hypothetical protein